MPPPPSEIKAGTLNTRTADPDADGLPNLMEYAFELNPRFANAGVTTLAANSGFLNLTYRRRHRRRYPRPLLVLPR